MKTINSILVIVTILILSSCIFSGGSDKENIKRKEVLGSWTTTAKSMEEQNADESGSLTIKSFQLNSDSTATVTYANSVETQRTGKWIWKVEKKLGNDNLGISIKTDVAIYVNGMIALGMQLNKSDGKMSLTAGDQIFEKE